jgi:hypothetical protein
MTTRIQFFAVEYHGGDMHPYARWRHFGAANDAEAVLAGRRFAPPPATSFTLYRSPPSADRVLRPPVAVVCLGECDSCEDAIEERN